MSLITLNALEKLKDDFDVCIDLSLETKFDDVYDKLHHKLEKRQCLYSLLYKLSETGGYTHVMIDKNKDVHGYQVVPDDDTRPFIDVYTTPEEDTKCHIYRTFSGSYCINKDRNERIFLLDVSQHVLLSEKPVWRMELPDEIIKCMDEIIRLQERIHQLSFMVDTRLFYQQKLTSVPMWYY